MALPGQALRRKEQLGSSTQHTRVNKSTLLCAKGHSTQPDMFWRTYHTKSDPKSMRVMPLCLWGGGLNSVAGRACQDKSSQVNTLPKAKSQAEDKRPKDRQKYAALRCKVGVAPPGLEAKRKMSRVAFRVFPAGRAGDTRAAICAISCFVSRFCVCWCM